MRTVAMVGTAVPVMVAIIIIVTVIASLPCLAIMFFIPNASRHGSNPVENRTVPVAAVRLRWRRQLEDTLYSENTVLIIFEFYFNT